MVTPYPIRVLPRLYGTERTGAPARRLLALLARAAHPSTTARVDWAGLIVLDRYDRFLMRGTVSHGQNMQLTPLSASEHESR